MDVKHGSFWHLLAVFIATQEVWVAYQLSNSCQDRAVDGIQWVVEGLLMYKRWSSTYLHVLWIIIDQKLDWDAVNQEFWLLTEVQVASGVRFTRWLWRSDQQVLYSQPELFLQKAGDALFGDCWFCDSQVPNVTVLGSWLHELSVGGKANVIDGDRPQRMAGL